MWICWQKEYNFVEHFEWKIVKEQNNTQYQTYENWKWVNGSVEKSIKLQLFDLLEQQIRPFNIRGES